jgi:hypothetical protein
MDAGLGNLINAFYRAVNGEHDVPIPYREILLTSRLMDEVFAQIVRLPNRVEVLTS